MYLTRDCKRPKSRQVPLWIVQEFDNFIKEIWALDADKVEEKMKDVDKDGESDDSEGGEMDDDINQYINNADDQDDTDNELEVFIDRYK